MRIRSGPAVVLAAMAAWYPGAGFAAVPEAEELFVQEIVLSTRDGKEQHAFQIFEPSSPGTALFEGQDDRGRPAYLDVPMGELFSLSSESPEVLVVETARGSFVLHRPTVFFGKEGIRVFTGFTNDPSCPDGGIGPVIWVRDDARRSILPRHLDTIHRIVWGPRSPGTVRLLGGTPEDLPMGKGTARVPLEGGRKELQSFNPAIGAAELKAVLSLLPSVPGGLEDTFPIVWPPRGSDFPLQETYLRYLKMASGMSREVEGKVAALEVPQGFLPLRQAFLDFLKKKLALDQAVEAYATKPDFPRLKASVLAIFPHPEVEEILDRVGGEGATLGVLDQLDNRLYPRIYQLFVNHGPPGRMAIGLLEENRLRIVSDPRVGACPAPMGGLPAP